ncbi:MAG: LytR C-terminal domain-containing protein [Acidimicrobiaceae bacterium]|nr:LytR C-terminal domain-containing protein [Acidimicrobiia bacterium]MCY4493094.1 LytR C-terminal domain-containing protein [Acidimicrobiaceae bacterium]
MTAPGRYAASDNSFARSTATAAARGGILIVVAIVIGVLLLWQGFDGDETAAETDPPPEESESGVTEETTVTTARGTEENDVTGETTSTTTTAAPVVVDPPNSVKVAVLNGRAENGLAGRRSNHLKTAGYVSIAANADTNYDSSRVYYTPGYADEAELVAVALNGSPSVIEAAPADPLTLVSETHREDTAGYHIYVVLGGDQVLG